MLSRGNEGLQTQAYKALFCRLHMLQLVLPTALPVLGMPSLHSHPPSPVQEHPRRYNNGEPLLPRLLTMPPLLLTLVIVTQRLIVMMTMLPQLEPLDEAEHIGVDTEDWDCFVS